MEGDKPDDIALHLDFRFDENSLVLNTLTAGSWGNERRFPNPTRRGQAFEVRILAQEDAFNVSHFLLRVEGWVAFSSSRRWGSISFE